MSKGKKKSSKKKSGSSKKEGMNIGIPLLIIAVGIVLIVVVEMAVSIWSENLV